MSREFTSLDRDDHSFSVGADWAFSSRINAGLSAAYTITDYLEIVQNDGTSFTIGPTVRVKPTKFITVSGSVGYTVSAYDQANYYRLENIKDTSEFAGLTYQASILHTLNRRMSHNVRVSQSSDVGMGRNFTEILSVHYGWHSGLSRSIAIDASFGYETWQSSGLGGESADRFMFFIGTGFAITRLWSASMGYSFALKNSNTSGFDYMQNRVTLNVTRQF
jgi:hypothetical protein